MDGCRLAERCCSCHQRRCGGWQRCWPRQAAAQPQRSRCTQAAGGQAAQPGRRCQAAAGQHCGGQQGWRAGQRLQAQCPGRQGAAAGFSGVCCVCQHARWLRPAAAAQPQPAHEQGRQPGELRQARCKAVHCGGADPGHTGVRGAAGLFFNKKNCCPAATSLLCGAVGGWAGPNCPRARRPNASAGLLRHGAARRGAPPGLQHAHQPEERGGFGAANCCGRAWLHRGAAPWLWMDSVPRRRRRARLTCAPAPGGPRRCRGWA